MDFVKIRGCEAAKRAALIAIAGGHSITLIGRAGHGKTMLATAILDTAYAAGLEVPKVVESLPCREAKEATPEARSTDMQCEVGPVAFREMTGKEHCTSTADILRQLGRSSVICNDLSLSASCLQLMKAAWDELGLSPRAYNATIRVARTIANLEPDKQINENHLAEAIQYQLLSRIDF